MFEIIFENWKLILSLFALILFAAIVYMRIIKNNEIFEEFKCENQLGMLPPSNESCHSIPIVMNGQKGELRGIDFNMSNNNNISQMNSTRPQCSNYIINSPPISSMFNIADMCHTNNKKEQLEWDCFYRYNIQKNMLKNPNWAKNIFVRNSPIFYKI
jgi:hypothetical protein